MDQIPSCHIHSSTRFSIFFQWILEKRDEFCEFIRKWLTNYDKSTQACNKSYNDLETVLKKKRNSQYQRNRKKITIYYVKFFNRGLGAIEQKPTIFKINNWRKTSWRRQIIRTLISQPISPPADQVKRQKYIILCRRTIIYDLQLLKKIKQLWYDATLCFCLSCG